MDRTCSIEDCDRRRSTRGWCQRHYTRWYRHGDPLHTAYSHDLAERMLGYIVPTGFCWEWSASIDDNGYTVANVGGVRQPGHRVIYQLLVGPVPAGLELDHLCRNRGCVNPDHLEPVTRRENIRRSPVVANRPRDAAGRYR